MKKKKKANELRHRAQPGYKLPFPCLEQSWAEKLHLRDTSCILYHGALGCWCAPTQVFSFHLSSWYLSVSMGACVMEGPCVMKTKCAKGRNGLTDLIEMFFVLFFQFLFWFLLPPSLLPFPPHSSSTRSHYIVQTGL